MPAALLGGFGRPDRRKPHARYARIVVRDLQTGQIRRSRAENEAHRRALYSLQLPPAGVARDVVDRLWDTLEAGLPHLILRVESRSLLAGDEDSLFDYAASMWVRHPSFAIVAAHHQATRGAPAPTGDAVQVMRVEGLMNQRRMIKDWRWRILHTCPDAPRFVINDLGFIGIAERPHGESSGELLSAAFVPLSPRVGLLAYLDHPSLPPQQPPFKEHRDVIPSWVHWLNACATSVGRGTLIEAHNVFAHPDDEDALRNLPDAAAVRPNWLGPFRGVGGSAVTLLE